MALLLWKFSSESRITKIEGTPTMSKLIWNIRGATSTVDIWMTYYWIKSM